MRKILENEILVEGAKLKARKIDCQNIEIKREINNTKEKQDEIFSLKYLDYRKLENTYITI